jgi:cation diffusion facilitator CzcD-associated flavoprotein CzcO
MSGNEVNVDVVVVGAGFGGLYALQHLRSLGQRVLVLEAGDGVGGTWFWNRYPGARVDLESPEYSYSFPPELQEEWTWSERYAGQQEVERYLNWVADRLDLRSDIRLRHRVKSVALDEDLGIWRVTAEAASSEGETEFIVHAKYCILAAGFLSAPILPDIPGIADFAGDVYHTAMWPREEPDFAGRRVGVIGAGASGVQVIQTIAPTVGDLTVFQRTANWCLPLRNAPMSAEYERYVKDNYQEIRELERTERGGGAILMGEKIAPSERRQTAEVDTGALLQDFEERWALGGLHMSRSFVGLNSDPKANDLLRDFLAKKIRAQVADAAVAEILVPTIPPLSRRTPGETNYYKVYNRPNVRLVDVRSDPIVEVAQREVVLASGERIELDVLICATGFDAGTGSILNIDISGREGRRLSDAWTDGARTSLGLMVNGFPNLFLINAVQSPSAYFSPPLLAEYQMGIVTVLIQAADDNAWKGIEPTLASQDRWVARVNQAIEGTLVSKTESWWMGTNVSGKPRQPVAFIGGFPAYVKECEAFLEQIQPPSDSAFATWGPQS